MRVVPKTSGFDTDIRGRFDAGAFGRLQAEINWTFMQQYELVAAGSTSTW